MALETVLHKIVNHLPIQPSIKDELLKEISAEFLEDTHNADE